MKIIGITGGIGCGKSAVCGFLREKYKAAVILTDNVGHEVMMPGTECYRRIVESFGEDITGYDGTIDRKKLGDIVFKDSSKLKLLNSIVHPEVFKEVDRRIEAAGLEKRELVVLEAALPGGPFKEKCDECWYVYARKEVRIQRLLASRDITREKAESIMEKQLSEEEFTKQCDFIVDNSGDFEDTSMSIAFRLAKRFGI